MFTYIRQFFIRISSKKQVQRKNKMPPSSYRMDDYYDTGGILEYHQQKIKKRGLQTDADYNTPSSDDVCSSDGGSDCGSDD